MTNRLDPLTFPLHGARLIEASAGTGKTYTIAALYLRLVLGHGGENGFGRALTPPEILVVTFTEAATQELKDRIRTRLTEAAAFFRGQKKGDDFLKALSAQFGTLEWSVCADLLEHAAQWMDEAAIYTIHSWCQRMLRQHAFDSGSLFDLSLEPDEEPLLLECVCDYWRSYLYPQDPATLSFLLDMISCQSPGDLLHKIRPLFALEIDNPTDPFKLLAKRQADIEEARQIWAQDFNNAVDQVRQAHANNALDKRKYGKDSLEKWISRLSEWVNANAPLPEDTIIVKFSAQGLSEGCKKNRSAPVHPAYSAFDRLKSTPAMPDIKTPFFLHAAADICRRFKAEKHRRAQMGFDDLLSDLSSALRKPGNGQLGSIIREQFPVAMIDEFQDTDSVQYSVFRMVYLNQPDVGLFMIGDPKQAIYAFRGGDIFTYLAARQDAGENRYTLGRNYRSSIGVVEAVQKLFGHASNYPDGVFKFGDRIPLEKIAAQGRGDQLVLDGKSVSGLYMWQLPQSEPVAFSGINSYQRLMAEATASQIARWLNLAEKDPASAGFLDANGNSRAFRPADIAILVRDRFEAREIRRALDARRIRSVYLSDRDSVFEAPEAESLYHLLCACAEPGQGSLLRAALATPLLDLPISDLDRLNHDEHFWEGEIGRFQNFHRIWQRRGVLSMLRCLLMEFQVPGRLLSETSGERVLTNLLHLSEMLQTAAVQLDGEQPLIRWFAEQINHPNGNSEEQILRLESDEELVKVVTIHKSKGLEYPLVFLPFICSFRKVEQKNTPVAKYHDARGNLKLVPNPTETDCFAADWERLAEDLRLLYVGMTRAQYACWLGIGVAGRYKRNELHQCGLGYLLSGGKEIPTTDLSSILLSVKGDCPYLHINPLPIADQVVYQPGKKKDTLAPARTFSGRIRKDWWIASYSGILADHDQPALAFPDSATEDHLQEAESESSSELPAVEGPAIHQFPRGAGPGTFLHSLLEWAANNGFSLVVSDKNNLRDWLTVNCQRYGWEDWVDVLADWLLHLLALPLPIGEDAFCLADLRSDSYKAEMEFLFSAHRVDTRFLDRKVTEAVCSGEFRPAIPDRQVNGMLKGFIDFVCCHEGRYYVMDYKSNYLGADVSAYTLPAMAAAMLEHRYDLQYVLYTLALHRLLTLRLADYDYDRHMGGAIYLFLRGVDGEGHGIYHHKPPRELIASLDAHFAGREVRYDT